MVRKQVSVSKKDLEGWRAAYEEKEDGYKAAAETKGWKPEIDVGGKYDEKLWYRWDWKLEVSLLLSLYWHELMACIVSSVPEESQRRKSL